MTTNQVVEKLNQLRSQREALDKLITDFETVIAVVEADHQTVTSLAAADQADPTPGKPQRVPRFAVRPLAAPPKRNKKFHMSAAARKRISETQKKRWADLRKSKAA